MKSLKCNNCGAPLEITKGEKIVHCTYCNADMLLDDPKPKQQPRPQAQQPQQPQQPWPATLHPNKPKKKRNQIMALVLFLTLLVFGGAFFWFGVSSDRQFDREAKKMDKDYKRKVKKMDKEFERNTKRMRDDFNRFGRSSRFGRPGRTVIIDDMGNTKQLPPGVRQQILDQIRRQQTSPRLPMGSLPSQQP